MNARVLQTIYDQRQSITGTVKEVYNFLRGSSLQRCDGISVPRDLFCVLKRRYGMAKAFCYLPHETCFIKIAFGEKGAQEIEEELQALAFVEKKGPKKITPATLSSHVSNNVSWITSKLVSGSRGDQHVTFPEVCHLLNRIYTHWGKKKEPAETYLDGIEEAVSQLERATTAPLRLLSRLRTVFEGETILTTHTHGDLGPSNILQSENGLLLIDWSTLAVRSASYDAFELIRRRRTIEEAVKRVRRNFKQVRLLLSDELTSHKALAYYGLALLEHEIEMNAYLRSQSRIRDYNKKQFNYVFSLL